MIGATSWFAHPGKIVSSTVVGGNKPSSSGYNVSYTMSTCVGVTYGSNFGRFGPRLGRYGGHQHHGCALNSCAAMGRSMREEPRRRGGSRAVRIPILRSMREFQGSSLLDIDSKRQCDVNALGIGGHVRSLRGERGLAFKNMILALSLSIGSPGQRSRTSGRGTGKWRNKATARNGQKETQQTVKRATKNRRSKNGTGDLPEPTSRLPSVLTVLAITGATTGTFLDGIHSRANVLVYDSAPMQIGGLHTSLWVPPLLAGFYAILGAIILWSDYRLAASGDGPTIGSLKTSGLSRTALSFGALAAMLELSSIMYTSHHPSEIISVSMAAVAAINYLVFDGTKQGLLLATVCALGAPAIELVLMSTLHLWHYPQGDLWSLGELNGIPRWVPLCYFMYIPAVANYTRWLLKTL